MDTQLYSRLKQLIVEFDAIAGDGKALCLTVIGTDLALLCSLRQPGAPFHIERMAYGKAHTCARMGCSTDALHKRLLREQRTLADFMDPHMTAMQGGVPLLDKSGSLVAGIGISGRLPEEDEVIALKVRDFLCR